MALVSGVDRLRVLFLDDDPEVMARIADVLSSGWALDLDRAHDEASLLAALERRPELVISAFHLATLDGMRALELVVARAPFVPFLFVTAPIGESRAAAAIRAGARDVIVETELEPLPSVVRRELADAATRRERVEAETRALQTDRGYRGVLDAASVAIAEIDLVPIERYGVVHGMTLAEIADRLLVDPALGTTVRSLAGIRRANRAFFELHGIPLDGSMVSTFEERPAPVLSTRSFWRALVQLAIAPPGHDTTGSHEIEVHAGGGTTKRALASATRSPHLPATTVIISLYDVTELRRIEQRMRSQQRLEAVSRLASGVAHDFNNLLMVLGSSIDTLDEEATRSDAIEDVLEALRDVVTRGKNLTRQLATFGKRDRPRPELVDVAQTVGELRKLLRRLVGESVRLEVQAPSRSALRATVDPAQLEQVVVSLVTNARDAIGVGGVIRVQVADESLPSERRGRVGTIAAGDAIRISVVDDGCGMDDATLARIFEPLFTTKPDGQGTGLGLATVSGIVGELAGAIDVRSAPGEGTTFDVWLPAAPRVSRAPAVSARARPGETVLVLEDQELVLAAIRKTLVSAGYDVLEATGAEELETVLESAVRVDLVVSDVVLRHSAGPELVPRVLAQFPRAASLFVSGYRDDVIRAHGLPIEKVELLPKPFDAEVLRRRVRALLDAQGERR